MICFERILHPTDFSEPSHDALEYAKALCERFDAELHALHVLPNPAAVPVMPGSFVPPQLTESQQACRQEAAKLLASLVPNEWQERHRVQRVTRQGSPFLGIIEYAREADIDLIVLGTHGRSGLAQMLLGSVAEKVVRKAPCPVLTVRPQVQRFVMP
jgi:nucleotide-binding universal stress UspA family protein